MQGFAFNLRRPLFHSRDVRHALSLALDFNWMNSSLFYGLYTANTSFFDNSELALGTAVTGGTGLAGTLACPASPAAFTEPMEGLGKHYTDVRQRLRAAQQLLKKAGWEVQNGVLTETATGHHAVYHHAGSGGFPAHR